MTELDMNRTLRYASHSYNSLRNNGQQQFAARNALQLYRSGAVYSFIPKNACSTMRLTLALENCCIKDIADFNWIHHNNDSFVADLPSLINAPYTFVVLRCPFARVASAFLDKIVGHSPEAWQMYDVIRRSQQISTFTFDFFVKNLVPAAVRNSNIHWRPQMDFLVYEEYDDYFCVEEFDHAVKTLREKIGLAVVDARKLIAHGIDSFEIIQGEESFTHASALEIMNLKASGKCPNPRALFSPELVDIVRNIYKNDIDFYAQQFGEGNLMFAPREEKMANIDKLQTECVLLNDGPATQFFVLPKGGITLSVCDSCARNLTQNARETIAAMLVAQEPYPNERRVYQPLDLPFPEFTSLEPIRSDSGERFEIMSKHIHEKIGEFPIRTKSYIDIGCNTGYFCKKMADLDFKANGVDIVPGDIRVAKLMDSYFHQRLMNFTCMDAVEFIEKDYSTYDVVSTFSVFQWIYIHTEKERVDAALYKLFGQARKLVFFEMAYTEEKHYKGRLSEVINRDWCMAKMNDSGFFSEVILYEEGHNGLKRDFFVGIRNENI